MAGYDWIVRHECLVKHRVGGGDGALGARRILGLLHDHALAIKMEQRAAREGLSPEDVAEQMRKGTPVGLQDLQVGYLELKERTRVLSQHVGDCDHCPGNAAGRGYGCFGSLRYPIPRWVEKWLLNRLRPAGTLAGDHFLASLEKLSPDKVRALRKRGVFQLEVPLERTLSRGWLRKVTVDADRVLQPLLGAGAAITPRRCLDMLVWFDAVRIDGASPARLEDLTELKPGEPRLELTRLDVGPPEEDPHVRAVQHLLSGLHRAWALGVPVVVQV